MSRHRLPSIPHPTQKDAALNKILQAIRERLENISADMTAVQSRASAAPSAPPVSATRPRPPAPAVSPAPLIPVDVVADLANAFAIFYPPDAPQAQGGGVPIGSVFPFAGLLAPDLYLICNGQAVSRAIFADLFQIIGTRYGIGDGSTTFNVPDLRRRYVAGPGTDFPADEVVGENFTDLRHDHALEDFGIGPAPNHTHLNNPTNASVGTVEVQAGTGATVAAAGHTHDLNPTALNGVHVHVLSGEVGAAEYPAHPDPENVDNRPETLVMNFIIRARA